jgi:hypothetical protein
MRFPQDVAIRVHLAQRMRHNVPVAIITKNGQQVPTDQAPLLTKTAAEP